MNAKLTLLEKVMRIAKACPFVLIEDGRPFWQPRNDNVYKTFCPFHDLNACRAMALSLDVVSRRLWAEKVVVICFDEMPGDVLGNQFTIINATAAQRAESFGQTLKLWEAGE